MSDTGDPVWVCRQTLIQKNTKTVQLIKYKVYRFLQKTTFPYYLSVTYSAVPSASDLFCKKQLVTERFGKLLWF